ncbi:MAG: glycosyl hydrolase 53 family protein [Prevotella sp.]|nr:glycosyl hydrolase 53 family protein [Prevotella sp.]
MVTRIFLLVFVSALLPLIATAQSTFTNGADISWVTEMEADGKTFHNTAGQETDCFKLMNECGISAVRLRVWVEPASASPNQNSAYGFAWSDKADVVAKAKRAVQAGLDVMIDFHYSDIFADPSRQTKPVNWSSFSFEDLQKAVSDHTTDVLSALKEVGISPRWIQIGNETRNGMLWPDGQLWTKNGDIPNGWEKFTKLYMAGYNAAKAVCPEAIVMPHIDNAYEDNAWWFDKLKANGGKFDMIALSHYPQSYTTESADAINTKAISQVKKLISRYGVNVMIAEVGVKTKSNETTAKAVLETFYNAIREIEGCAGIFYWEPQLYGWWKPKAYADFGWNAYDMGAFDDNGCPTTVLDCFKNNPTTSNNEVHIDNVVKKINNAIYTMDGKRISAEDTNGLGAGLYIVNNKKVMVK